MNREDLKVIERLLRQTNKFDIQEYILLLKQKIELEDQLAEINNKIDQFSNDIEETGEYITTELKPVNIYNSDDELDKILSGKKNLSATFIDDENNVKRLIRYVLYNVFNFSRDEICKNFTRKFICDNKMGYLLSYKKYKLIELLDLSVPELDIKQWEINVPKDYWNPDTLKAYLLWYFDKKGFTKEKVLNTNIKQELIKDNSSVVHVLKRFNNIDLKELMYS